MTVTAACTNFLIDILDRILDKGTIVDPCVRISLAGIDLVTTDVSVIVVDRTMCLSHDSLELFLENCPYATRKPKGTSRDDYEDVEGSALRPVPVKPRKPVLSGSVAAAPPENPEEPGVENISNPPQSRQKPDSNSRYWGTNERSAETGAA